VQTGRGIGEGLHEVRLHTF